LPYACDPGRRRRKPLVVAAAVARSPQGNRIARAADLWRAAIAHEYAALDVQGACQRRRGDLDPHTRQLLWPLVATVAPGRCVAATVGCSGCDGTRWSRPPPEREAAARRRAADWRERRAHRRPGFLSTGG